MHLLLQKADKCITLARGRKYSEERKLLSAFIFNLLAHLSLNIVVPRPRSPLSAQKSPQGIAENALLSTRGGIKHPEMFVSPHTERQCRTPLYLTDSFVCLENILWREGVLESECWRK